MARPQLATDEQIYAAAARVIARRGPDAFTLAEVAEEVGLSRAAIILRFKSTEALKIALLTQMVDRFVAELSKLPQEPGGDSLLAIGSFLGRHIKGREGSAAFFARYSRSVMNKDQMALEQRRGRALREAISKAMPEVSIDHAAAVEAFNTHIAGSIIVWLGLDDPDPHAFLVARTKAWLRLVGIPFTEDRDAGAASKPRSAAAPVTRKTKTRAVAGR